MASGSNSDALNADFSVRRCNFQTVKLSRDNADLPVNLQRTEPLKDAKIAERFVRSFLIDQN